MQESGEMYLETILMLSHDGKQVRAVDIAETMGFSRPSVSRALSLLRESGHVTVDEKGCVALTPGGDATARKIYERHRLLGECLIRLGVDEDTAHEDACRIEHVISERSFNAIKEYLEKSAE